MRRPSVVAVDLEARAAHRAASAAGTRRRSDVVLPATPTSQLWCWTTQSKNVASTPPCTTPGGPSNTSGNVTRARRVRPVDGDLVLGEARVVGADVARVVDVRSSVGGRVGTDPRSRIGRHPARERALGGPQVFDELAQPRDRRARAPAPGPRRAAAAARPRRPGAAARRRTSTAPDVDGDSPSNSSRTAARSTLPDGVRGSASTSFSSSGSS